MSYGDESIEAMTSSPPFRSGFCCFVGRPNAGKSTLTNALVGSKIAITSTKPQTTRHAVRGVINRPDAQLVVVDTPVQPRRVDDDELRVRPVDNPADRMPGRLGFRTGDCDLATNERVRQRGLAGVRSAHEAAEARPEGRTAGHGLDALIAVRHDIADLTRSSLGLGRRCVV